MRKICNLILVFLITVSAIFTGCTALEQEAYNTDLAYKIAYYQDEFGVWDGGLISGSTTTNLTGFLLADGTYISSVPSNPITLPRIQHGGTGGQMKIYGGDFDVAGVNGALIYLFGNSYAGYEGKIQMGTPNAAATINVPRLTITGLVDLATAAWANVLHTGMRMGATVSMHKNDISFEEMTAPGAGGANIGKMYAHQGAGDNLTDMAVIFQDGTVDIFAQETTPLDAPIFRYPSQTIGTLVLEKPHAGLLKILMVFPDGTTFTLKEYEYHDYDKVMANTGCEGELPKDWLIETKATRDARNIAEKQKMEDMIK